MSTLILTESHIKSVKINECIQNSNEYKCLPTYGALRTIAHLSDINIIQATNTVEVKYTNIQARTAQIDKIQKAIALTTEVYIATNTTFEGELLAWHICDTFNLHDIKVTRIKIREFTQQGILDAISTPYEIDLCKVYAQRAREIIDMLISYTFSPILWKAHPNNNTNTLFADRVPIPVLQLIHHKTTNSKPSVLYKITGYFTRLMLPFELNRNLEEKNVTPFFESLKGFKFNCTVSSPISSTVSPPLPLITSTLIKRAITELFISSDDTILYAQYLYEHGYITSPHTFTDKYSKKFTDTVETRISQTHGEIYKKYTNTHLNQEDGGEEAIRPTSIELLAKKINKIDGIHPKAVQLYDLIWRTTLQSCMADDHTNTITVSINAPNGYIFTYKSVCSSFRGWGIVENKIIGGEEGYNYLQNLNTDSQLVFGCANARFMAIDMASPYDECGLLNKLIETGIDVEIPKIIDRLKHCGYIRKGTFEGINLTLNDYTMSHDGSIYEKLTTRNYGNKPNCIIVEPLGISILETLTKYMGIFFAYNFAKTTEQELNNISKGTAVWSEICLKIHATLNEHNLISHSSSFSYKIDDAHTVIDGKYGLCVKKTDIDGQTTFLKVNPGITIEHFEHTHKNTLALNDIIVKSTTPPPPMELGKHRGQTVFIKKGPYGYYAEWGNNRASLKDIIDSNVGALTYPDIYKILEQHEKDLGQNKGPPGVVRQVNKSLSIRVGKIGKGDYLLFKTPRMKTPSFFSLAGFPGDYKKCTNNTIIEWVNAEHGVCVK